MMCSYARALCLYRWRWLWRAGGAESGLPGGLPDAVRADGQGGAFGCVPECAGVAAVGDGAVDALHGGECAAGIGAALVFGQTGPQALAPEEVLTVPVFGTIGGVVGGMGAGVVGFFVGAKSVEKVYDWTFTPLEKEEWEILCEE